MIAERCCECDLLLRGRARRDEIRSPEALDKPRRQLFDGCCAILFARLDDPCQGRPAKGADPQKTCAEGSPGFARQRGWIQLRKHEGAGYGPFAGLRRLIKDKRIRRISPDGLQKLHARSS
jgi:hypothetical protein